MNSARKSPFSYAALFCIVTALAAGPASQAQAKAIPPGVIPPHGKVFGKTYGEWGAKWWQYISKLPWSTNPLNDATGAYCALGQKGKVWFLTDVLLLDRDIIITRTCAVPSNKAIFFPIMAFESDNINCYPQNVSIDVLRQQAHDEIDHATVLSVEMDGSALPSYRLESSVFDYTLPADNWLNGIEALAPGSCPLPTPAGTYGPSVSDGYWVMLAPLAVGQHTLHFRGTFTTPSAPLLLDITYHLTIVPGRDDDAAYE